jgi:flagella basal body P-ring formation protein FlgA
VARRAVIALALLTLLGAAEIRAELRAAPLGKEQVEQALREHVLKGSLWKAGQIEVRALSFKPPRLPAGEVKLQVLKPGNGLGPGVHTFLLAAGETQFWVRAEVKLFSVIVVSSRPLAHRQLIAPEDVRLELREVGASPPRPFNRIDEVVGKMVARSIDMNEPVTSAVAESPRVLRYGSPVVLVYETNTLRVESPGLAVEGGKVGDTIQVKNASSGKVLQAVVLDGRTVRVR